MQDIVIYEKPTCSKCRIAISMVDASGKPFRKVRYHDERLPAKKILDLAQKIGIRPKELVRTNEPRFKELAVDLGALDDTEVAKLLAAEPDLLQRPILECGDKAILGRTAEAVTGFLKEFS